MIDTNHIYEQGDPLKPIHDTALWNSDFQATGSSITLLPVTYTGMRRITTFRSTTDRIYDGGPKR